MFNNLANTQLADANEDELALAMGGEPQPEADKGKGKGKEAAAPTQGKDKPTKQPKASSSKSTVTPTLGSISDIADDDLKIALQGQIEDEDEGQEDEGEENEDGEEAGAEEGAEENEGEEGKGEEGEEEGADDGANIDVKDFLKARVNLLIEKGEWVDFEGRDDVEWDEETFEEMELNQRNYQREVIREELLESFGPYGKQIAAYAANGGDPDKLIDLFKEEQRIDNLSIETEDGQRSLVLKYYTQVLGWSEAKANKQIQTHIADKELESTAAEFKGLLKKDIDKQVANAEAEQERAVAAEKAKQAAVLKQFSDNVATYVSSNTDLSAEEKQEIIRILKFDKQLKNGAPVNDFYFKFAELKKNLPDYIQLVRFVMDPKKFTKTLVTQGNNKAVEKAFKLTRTNNANKKAKTLAAPGANHSDKPKTAFKLM